MTDLTYVARKHYVHADGSVTTETDAEILASRAADRERLRKVGEAAARAPKFNARGAWDFASETTNVFPRDRNECRAIVLRFACKHFPSAHAWQVESVAAALYRDVLYHS